MSSLDYAESNGEPVQKFVYLCVGCNGILETSGALKPLDGIIDRLYGRCPSCGSTLEGSVECKLTTIAEDLQATPLAVPPVRPRPKHALFQRASSYKRFSLDFLPLDRLLQPLNPGNLLMLRGSGASTIAELLAFRAQLPEERGGLDSSVFFIDGGNCSDPYLFASLARHYSFDTKRALRRVTNCRVFTTYQLANLLSNDVMRMTETYGSKLLVMANLLGTFNEPGMSAREVDRLLDAVRAGIMEAKKKLVVVATLGSPNRYDEAVTAWSDTLVRLSLLRRGTIQADLLRHPTKKVDTVEFAMNQLLFHPDSLLEPVR